MPDNNRLAQALDSLLELLWEMRTKRDGSPNAFYRLADRTFPLADEVAALLADVQIAQQQELDKLNAALDEYTSVCACGCPLGEHENYGEDGESCENDDHECVRTSAAVADMLELLRDTRLDAATARETALRALVEQWRHRELIAGQWSVEAKDEAHIKAAEIEAMVWRRCADELAALLAAPPAETPYTP